MAKNPTIRVPNSETIGWTFSLPVDTLFGGHSFAYAALMAAGPVLFSELTKLLDMVRAGSSDPATIRQVHEAEAALAKKPRPILIP